jgi:hypothetical protein
MSCTGVMGDQKSNWTNSDGYTSHNTCPYSTTTFSQKCEGVCGVQVPHPR